MKNCRQCGTNEHGFNKDKSKADGIRNVCKKCEREKDRKRRASNLEKSRKQARESYRRNREKRIKKVREYYMEGGGRERERERVRERASKIIEVLGGKCKECGRKDSLSIDHVHDDGGEQRKRESKDSMVRKLLASEEERRRVQILCHSCNQRKQLRRTREKRETETGVKKECGTCRERKDQSEFHRDAGYGDGRYYECRTCTRLRREEVKEQAIRKLGGECKECGEKDMDVLCVDHRRPIGLGRQSHGYILYNRIILGTYDPEQFQVLCFNCNQMKGGAGERGNGEESLKSRKPRTRRVVGEEALIEYELKNLTVQREDRKRAFEFLESYHYDGYGRHAKACYSASMGEEIVAVAKFCSVTRQGTPGSLGLVSEQVMELDRMAASPRRQKKNLMSWFLSRVVKMVKEDFEKVEALVSFADTEVGHDGAVYRASNWEESGRTAPSYYYVNPDGEVVKKKSFFDWMKVRGLKEGKTETEVAEEMGMEKVRTAPKIRFILRV